MKKLLLAAAVMVAACGSVEAVWPEFAVPKANTAQPAFAEYGGVNVSTSIFNSNFTTVSAKPCRAYGVTFSSGSSADYASIYSTGTWATTAVGGVSTETIRVYNVASTTQSVTVGAASAGYVPIGPYPIRLPALGWKLSVDDYNSALLHYVCEE